MFVEHHEEEGPTCSTYKQYNFINKNGHIISLIRLLKEEDHEAPELHPNMPLSEEHFKEGRVWFGLNQFTQPMEMGFLNSLAQSWEDQIPYDLQIQNLERHPLLSADTIQFWRTHKGNLLLDKASLEIRSVETNQCIAYFSYLTAPVKWFFSGITPRILMTSQEAPQDQKHKWETLAKLNYRCTRSTGYGMQEQNYEEALASFEGTPSLPSKLSDLSPEEKSLWQAYFSLKTQFQILKFLAMLKNRPVSLKKDLHDHFDTMISTLKEANVFETQGLRRDLNLSLTPRLLLAFHILKMSISETDTLKATLKGEIELIFASLNPLTQDSIVHLESPNFPLRTARMAGLFANSLPAEICHMHTLFKELPLPEGGSQRLSFLSGPDQINLGTSLKISTLLSAHASLFSNKD
ncbi:MAG: hypothetical protein JSS34_01530 [Proteobacteria bacterium]|nr:hypothetical protein [Pseudomonadota bacterium]